MSFVVTIGEHKNISSAIVEGGLRDLRLIIESGCLPADLLLIRPGLLAAVAETEGALATIEASMGRQFRKAMIERTKKELDALVAEDQAAERRLLPDDGTSLR